MKTIMILGASILQVPAIKKARGLGLKTVVCDMNPNAVGFSIQGVIKEVVSTVDTKKILEVANKHNIDGIMTLATDMPMRSVAKVAKELGLVGISEDTALKATNKAYMRDALKLAGVPIPMYYEVNSKKEFMEAVNNIKEMGCRCIIKPADNSGSKGIDLLDSFDDESLNRAYEYSLMNSRNGGVMVEEFMDGPEVSVETLAIDGEIHVIQVTDKLTTGEPYFVEMGHNQPSLLSSALKEEISRIAIEANHAIGIENGPSHTEIKVTDGIPKIVELGARLGGDNITTHLVPLSTGVDMVKCCIQIALGEKPNVEIKNKKAAAIRYFKQHEGVIRRIDGINDANRMDGIVQISVVHGIGEHIDNINNSGTRMGFVIAQSETPQKAIQICEDALKKIYVEIE
ncbi:ATP-grasp domain-containing protein [Ligilactobacillus ruminis]|uniref:ATP-grasp domain-containing protein n=1 Tax=Ligilactobacillus ruminis TaxID=1623 RepID=UPI0009BA503C|nr:ATP-grasp domain-containing protein [Ligilactobacillus ruminis]WDC80021.1 ATP-grasp domain-containing protein [Ligilactobacillus ruminis]